MNLTVWIIYNQCAIALVTFKQSVVEWAEEWKKWGGEGGSRSLRAAQSNPISEAGVYSAEQLGKAGIACLILVRLVWKFRKSHSESAIQLILKWWAPVQPPHTPMLVHPHAPPPPPSTQAPPLTPTPTHWAVPTSGPSLDHHYFMPIDIYYVFIYQLSTCHVSVSVLLSSLVEVSVFCPVKLWVD